MGHAAGLLQRMWWQDVDATVGLDAAGQQPVCSHEDCLNAWMCTPANYFDQVPGHQPHLSSAQSLWLDDNGLHWTCRQRSMAGRMPTSSCLCRGMQGVHRGTQGMGMVRDWGQAGLKQTPGRCGRVEWTLRGGMEAAPSTLGEWGQALPIPESLGGWGVTPRTLGTGGVWEEAPRTPGSTARGVSLESPVLGPLPFPGRAGSLDSALGRYGVCCWLRHRLGWCSGCREATAA